MFAKLGAGSIFFGGALTYYATTGKGDNSELELRAEEWKAFAEEREKRRRAEIQRITSQASVFRLVEIFFTLLPAFIVWPLLFISPSTYWGYFATRIDHCGPTFVKLAQWLATRKDLFSDEVCEALSSMHRKVQARWSKSLTSAEVQAYLLNEHSVPLKSIEAEPHASGSIAEVFFGVMEDGKEVAVKCLRPGVQHALEADLAWLLKFGAWSERRFDFFRLCGVNQAAVEFCEQVQMQVDFKTEAAHLNRFRANFADGEEAVRFPVPIAVTPEALVLSREEGQELAQFFLLGSAAAAAQGVVSLKDVNNLGLPQVVSRQIARQSMAAYMRMIFNDRFIHGDMHPGNIMLHLRPEVLNNATAEELAASMPVTEMAALPAPVAGSASPEAPRPVDDQPKPSLKSRIMRYVPTVLGGMGGDTERAAFELVIVDAGLAIPLPPEKVEVLRSLAIAIIYGDFYRAAEILYQDSPDSSQCWDPVGFKTGLAKVFEACRRSVWDEGFVQVSDTCLEAFRLVQHYNVGLDTTLTWTLFGMLSVEGSARQLDPEVDCAKAATRYIITLPSLAREMKNQSWNTNKHMVAELAFKFVGMDYWQWRYKNGLTWKDLNTTAS